MTWLRSIAARRARAVAEDPRPIEKQRAKVVLEALRDAKVNEKLLARHGACLHPALDDMNAIAETSAAFDPYRATQFGHALDRFYHAVGEQLGRVEPEERERTGKIAISTMRSLIAEVGAVPELMPAMATLSSMLEPRGTHDVDPDAHARAAKSAVLELLRALEGKDGATSMIHAHRHVLEMLERAHPHLLASDRPRIWRAATDLILETMPRPGADFAKTAHLTATLFQALKDHPRDPEAALEATRNAVFAEGAEAREAARAQIEKMPEIVAPIASALSLVLEMNPAGPREVATAVEELAKRTIEHASRIVDPKPFDDLAHVIALVAETPAIRAILDHLTFNYPTMLESEGGRQAIARVAQSQDPDAVPYALVRAHAAQHGGDAEALEAAIASWKKMPPGIALRASLALMGHLNKSRVAPALARELGKVAPSIVRMEELTKFAQKFSDVYPTFASQLDEEDAGCAAVAMARRGGPIDSKVVWRTAYICRAAGGIVDDVPLERMIDSLLALGDTKQFAHDPISMTYELLRAVSEPRMDPTERAAHARAAIAVTVELGKLDRDARQTDFGTILEDWKRALADPKKLSWAPVSQKAAALRSKRSITAFLEAHPHLPPEVAITAAMHLSSEQLGWLINQLRSTRSQKDVRVLRDLVFAAVALDRIDLIDALRLSKSDRKSKLAAATLIAEHHRARKLDELPVDRIIEGLGRGEDPAGAIVKERAYEALASLNLGDLEKPTDERGAKVLQSVHKELTDLLAFFPVGGNVHGVSTARFRDPLLTAIRATAIGEWPRPKFEGEIADRQLGDLDSRARAIWEDDSITSNTESGVQPAELAEAMTYVRGLHQVLPANWNREMLDRLSAERNEKIEALHHATRGSAEHKRLSGELGPISRLIALIELKLAIEKLGPDVDAVTTLLELKPYVAAAIGPARKVAGPGITEALERILEASEGIRKPGREGIYAADESRLDAYFTSFGGSCLNPSTGFYRASLPELIMSAQYKIGRLMDGDKPLARAIFRLLRVKLPDGYEGYALRMDKPLLTTSWTQSPPEDQMRLLYKHGLNKAMAMGIPFIIDQPELVADHAQRLGCELAEDVNVRLWIDKGHTGVHHNQGLNSSDYFIAWPGLVFDQATVRPERPDDVLVERTYPMTVIRPPSAKSMQP